MLLSLWSRGSNFLEPREENRPATARRRRIRFRGSSFLTPRENRPIVSGGDRAAGGDRGEGEGEGRRGDGATDRTLTGGRADADRAMSRGAGRSTVWPRQATSAERQATSDEHSSGSPDQHPSRQCALRSSSASRKPTPLARAERASGPRRQRPDGVVHRDGHHRDECKRDGNHRRLFEQRQRPSGRLTEGEADEDHGRRTSIPTIMPAAAPRAVSRDHQIPTGTSGRTS